MGENNRNKKNGQSINKVKSKQLDNKFNNEDIEIKKLTKLYSEIEVTTVDNFKSFPLSTRSLRGLKEAGYTKPTDIQIQAIGPALQGKDILGAAITGSGKTLAFLIPVLECLFVKKWTRLDGLGAVIISPTRELAYQIFETLKKIGVHHELSAALIIGGKNLKFERRRMDQCNIVICTPGRLLQHMDENPLFNCVSMQILVLDEADRILDLGFEDTMNAIIENFPPERQTLLFSATQTKSVRDLARLSLKDPVYIAPHSQTLTTPVNLNQNFVVIDLEDKITMLWSFIKNHLKQKIIVFMSSCKQVKFITDMFAKLRAGTPVLGLYGTLHQDRRVAIYEEFMRKSNAVLICTDVASRGLDFPVVNWVVQLDCPEDSTAYIHRAGRTARHNAKGESLLILLPSEETAMIKELKDRKIPISQIFIDPKRMFSPRAKMEGYLAQNSELKATAQRAFVSYIKSIVLNKNKDIFNVDTINFDAYAKSLGLVVTPRVRFLERQRKRLGIPMPESLADEGETPHQFNVNDEEDGSEDECLFNIKRRDHDIEDDEESADDAEDILEKPISNKKLKPITKAAAAKKVLKKKIQTNKKVAYDDDGNEIIDRTKQQTSELAKAYEDSETSGRIDFEKVKQILKEEDHFDKLRFKERVKARHKERKRKLKESKLQNQGEEDDFGESSDNSDGPDLSWLPDPDKIYATSEDTQNALDDDDEEIFHKPPKHLLTKKRKHTEMVKIDPSKKTKRPKRIPTEELSINEAETLAMQLLGLPN